MVWSRRVLKLAALTLLGAALGGCIVLPYGARHGRHGHHLSAAPESAPHTVQVVQPRRP